MKKTILAIALLLASGSAQAQDSETSVFQPIITHQLQSIAKDDGASAYSDAAPLVQQKFPSADMFMSMVRNGYPQVYRNKSYSFGETGVDPAGRPYQKVQILGDDGALYDAIYFMEHEPDGSWKIAGCVMAKAKGDEA